MHRCHVLALVFPVVHAWPSSGANVLICCLVQPDGFLPPHWGVIGGVGKRGGGEEVTCGDFPSLKISVPKLHTPLSAPPFLVSPSSILPSQDKRANFYEAMTGSDAPTPPRSVSPPHPLCAAIYFFAVICLNLSQAHVWIETSYFGHHITGLLAYELISHKTNTFLAVDENKVSERWKRVRSES